ncbi:hypothetical protein H7H80_23150 [Mycobacterium interjectum]|nr:hypothetical protein [Mycobacterium interjectum]
MLGRRSMMAAAALAAVVAACAGCGSGGSKASSRSLVTPTTQIAGAACWATIAG